MALRTSHGKLRPEVVPADELSHANVVATGDMISKGRPFEKGNRVAAGRKPKLALLGVEVNATDPRYALSLRRASRYRKQRVAELARAHGYVSAGAAAMVASAALALCASRYLYELAAETGDPDTLKRASALAIDARQHELAAWEICTREAKSRGSTSSHAPWLVAEKDSES